MKYVRWGIGMLILLFIAIQWIPYGRNHTNPPVTASPLWDSPQTRDTFTRSCADCHSNETVWPWYSNVAPMSWLLQHDVEEGRAVLNVSVQTMGEGAEEAAEVVSEGEMPPRAYLLLHPSAAIAPDVQSTFLKGLRATFGGEDEEHERGQRQPALTRNRYEH